MRATKKELLRPMARPPREVEVPGLDLTVAVRAAPRQWPAGIDDAPLRQPHRGYRERHWERAIALQREASERGTNGLPALARLLYADEVARESRGCAKRGCCAVNSPWLTFSSGTSTYCLGHIPLVARARIWWQEMWRR